jgi:phage portal protein BeeE
VKSRVESELNWLGIPRKKRVEDRALAAPAAAPASIPYSPYSVGPADVTTSTALRVADAYACVRLLADSISSLPLHVFRKTAAGRVPAGEQSRTVQLLRSPSPGSTGVDLISQLVVHLRSMVSRSSGSTVSPAGRSCSSGSSRRTPSASSFAASG